MVNESFMSLDDTPQPPKDEKRHPIWKLSIFSIPTGLYHSGNWGYKSKKSVVYTFIFCLIMSAILYTTFFLYGTVKDIITTRMGIEYQGTDHVGDPIYTLPAIYNHT